MTQEKFTKITRCTRLILSMSRCHCVLWCWQSLTPGSYVSICESVSQGMMSVLYSCLPTSHRSCVSLVDVRDYFVSFLVFTCDNKLDAPSGGAKYILSSAEKITFVMMILIMTDALTLWKINDTMHDKISKYGTFPKVIMIFGSLRI